MAVGHERTPPPCLGQRQGLAVGGFGLCDLWRITMRRDVTKEAQGICLIPAFLIGTGMFQGTGGERARLLQATGAQMRLAQGEEQKRLVPYSAARGGLL